MKRDYSTALALHRRVGHAMNGEKPAKSRSKKLFLYSISALVLVLERKFPNDKSIREVKFCPGCRSIMYFLFIVVLDGIAFFAVYMYTSLNIIIVHKY